MYIFRLVLLLRCLGVFLFFINSSVAISFDEEGGKGEALKKENVRSGYWERFDYRESSGPCFNLENEKGYENWFGVSGKDNSVYEKLTNLREERSVSHRKKVGCDTDPDGVELLASSLGSEVNREYWKETSAKRFNKRYEPEGGEVNEGNGCRLHQKVVVETGNPEVWPERLEGDGCEGDRIESNKIVNVNEGTHSQAMAVRIESGSTVESGPKFDSDNNISRMNKAVSDTKVEKLNHQKKGSRKKQVSSHATANR